MRSIPTLDGVFAGRIETDRITSRVLFSGPEDGVPVIFLHGNHSSATWWEETMVSLPDAYRGIAPDMRGFGQADPELKIDATRGVADWGEDVISLIDHLGYSSVHLAGSSLGGNVGWWLIINAGSRLRSFVGVCPGSPIGFGGTKDAEGTPCWDDWAGGGAGLISAPFVEAIRNGDDTADTPFSPRAVFRARTWEVPPAREDALIESLLQIHLGEDAYPGDVVQSPNWPYVAPGVWGPNNAIACKYGMSSAEIATADPKPPIVWIRGADDLSVSNASAADIGTHGPSGVIPGWPGPDIYPPQPMLDQIRTTLDRYAEDGGQTEEIVMEGCGHAPFVEKPDEFNRILHRLLRQFDA